MASQILKLDMETTPCEPSSNRITSLIAMLPCRDIVNSLFNSYLTYVESSHRIFHIPSLVQNLDEFWTNKANPDRVNSVFAVSLLLILAIARKVADPELAKNANKRPFACCTSKEWVLQAENWIRAACIKRPDIDDFRLYCLFAIAKRTEDSEYYSTWLLTGTLVKKAMLAGYHRDPDHIAGISEFQGEMRRRIWATLLELDLQNAYDANMPPSLHEEQYDTSPPLNLNDSEISEGMSEMPPSLPLSEASDCLIQSMLNRSLSLRLTACKIAHCGAIPVSFEEVTSIDRMLTKHLLELPGSLVEELVDKRVEYRKLWLKSHVQAKIGQALMAVHKRIALKTFNVHQFLLSARARLNAASMILESQRRLHRKSEQLSSCDLGGWSPQASFAICSLLHVAKTHNLVLYLFSVPEIPASLISLVEYRMTIMEGRKKRIGKRGAKEYMFLSNILAVVKTKLWPEQTAIFKDEAYTRMAFFSEVFFG